MASGSHEDKFLAACEAYASLLMSGVSKKNIKRATVAQAAGLKRQIFNPQAHRDWRRLGEAIDKGTTIPEVDQLMPVARIQRVDERALDRLTRRIEVHGDLIAELEDLVNTASSTLVSEVQRYMYQALYHRIFPANKEDELIMTIEDKKRQLQEKEAVIVRLRQGQDTGGIVQLQARKPVINVGEGRDRGYLTANLLGEIALETADLVDKHFLTANRARWPSVVYITCGNFAAGKSTWVRKHIPPAGDPVLYIDGPHHTQSSRQEIIRRIRHHQRDCRVVCARVFTPVHVCLERNDDDVRARTKMAVPNPLIRAVNDAFDEVELKEGFDAIEIVQGGGDR